MHGNQTQRDQRVPSMLPASPTHIPSVAIRAAKRLPRRAVEQFAADRRAHGSSWAIRQTARRAAHTCRRGVVVARAVTFDLRHGVRTRGVVLFEDTTAVPAQYRDAEFYEATSVREFREVLSTVPVDWRFFTFVDLGCGLGRTLLLAAGAGFPRVVGVEIREDLLAAARSNVAAYRPRRRGRATRFEFVLADAARYRLPAGPVLLYMYNPFGEQTVNTVARNIDNSLRRDPRPFVVVYVNAVFADRFRVVPSLRPWGSHGAGWRAVYVSRL
jgi:SAM-dependent methyltransferase